MMYLSAEYSVSYDFPKQLCSTVSAANTWSGITERKKNKESLAIKFLNIFFVYDANKDNQYIKTATI